MLSGCTGRPDGVTPVSPFEIERYAGTWYEIMRLDHSFERGLSNVTATYSLNDAGTVDVLNRGYDTQACLWDEAEGVAKFLGDPIIASLSVTFFWPFAGGYHVIALDEAYGWALISGSDTGYLWVLAREPDLSLEIRNQLIDQAKSLGFPVETLIMVEHGETECMSSQ
ncbi:MAG: lipocalin family protein [Alphaproteobacteria bacterium]|nr:lipocalin family protein [Alphaproteobacteria bacterium]